MDGFVMENPIKMDDLRGPPLFLETPAYSWLEESLLNCRISSINIFPSWAKTPKKTTGDKNLGTTLPFHLLPLIFHPEEDQEHNVTTWFRGF